MHVKITKASGYLCAPLGHTVMHFLAGQIISGKAAEMAIADGAGIEINMTTAADLENKIELPLEAKRGPGRPRKP